MHESIVQQLIQINQEFYNQVASSFARTRTRPQPGFFHLANQWQYYFPQPCPSFLDVGCGEGRLGRFLQARRLIQNYTGIDNSQMLLNIAQQTTVGSFLLRNMVTPKFIDDLDHFAGIACLAAMQHIPHRQNRLHLLQTLANHLSPNGTLILSNWQFLNSSRQKRKIQPWSVIGLQDKDVEVNDYLLSWGEDNIQRRYVCWVGEEETSWLAQQAGLSIVYQFYSDGKEGNLNLYNILKKCNKILA